LQGGYDLVRRNATRVCGAYVSQECVQERGGDACVLELLGQLNGAEAEARRRTALVAAITSAVAVGELLAVAVCMAQLRQRPGRAAPAGGTAEVLETQVWMGTLLHSPPSGLKSMLPT
jgi:hypothetical protein